MSRKWWLWPLGIVVGLIVVVIALSFIVDEPLRRYAEQRINSRLQGYTVHVAKLDLHPWRFGVDLYDVSIVQNAYPEPPIVFVPRVSTSVYWRALLSARVVADVLVERPSLHLNLPQFRQESTDAVPLRERGWQEAIESVTLIKVNVLRVVDGNMTYVDEGPYEPVRLSQLNVRAENIRNIHSEPGVYPSDIHVRGVIFDTGTLWLEGRADFLAVPHAAVQAQFGIDRVELDYVKPITRHYNILLKGGTFSGQGELEYNPDLKVAHLHTMSIDGLRLDYVHTAPTAAVEERRVRQVRETAQHVSNAPGLLLRADEVVIANSEMGFINEALMPHYRVFLAPLELHLTNFSNQFTQGPMTAKLTGKFMGSGQTLVGATFRPETDGPDFALAASVENTDLRTMNQLLRAHGNFDVVQGFFSVFTEFRVKNGAVNGYVKPFFKEMDVYDAQQDQEKNLFQKIYEGLVGGVSQLLENMPRREIATKADIAGPLERPQTSTWQVLVHLIQNAFFDAILPGFERQRGISSR